MVGGKSGIEPIPNEEIAVVAPRLLLSTLLISPTLFDASILYGSMILLFEDVGDFCFLLLRLTLT